MKIIFLDTNIILDFLMKRDDFLKEAERILDMGYNQECKLFLSSLSSLSSLSFSNIAYIARQRYRGNELYDLLDKVREMMDVADVDKWAVERALKLRAKDFEDALQYYSALKINADYIITRNKKDFSFSDIKVLTPKEFLAL